MGFQVGQKVRLVSTSEVGIVVWLWTDPATGAEDAYVAFFGQEFPDGPPETKPYILRYLTSSLEGNLEEEV